jgi:hypothetical protein
MASARLQRNSADLSSAFFLVPFALSKESHDVRTDLVQRQNHLRRVQQYCFARHTGVDVS